MATAYRTRRQRLDELAIERKQDCQRRHPHVFRACGTLKNVPPKYVYVFNVVALLLLTELKMPILSALFSALVLLPWEFMFFFLLRMFLVMLFFSRFTLLHVFGLLLAINVLATLIVVCPGLFKALPIFGMFCLLGITCYFLAVQDPLGANYIPAFLRNRKSEAATERAIRDDGDAPAT